QTKISLQVVAKLMEHGPEGPRVYQAVIGQLNKREWIELSAQPCEGNAAAEGSWSEASSHVGERRRSRHRAGCAEPGIRDPVAIAGYPVHAQQPLRVLALALPE